MLLLASDAGFDEIHVSLAALAHFTAPGCSVDEIISSSVPFTVTHKRVETFEIAEHDFAEVVSHVDENVLRAVASLHAAIMVKVISSVAGLL